MPSDRPLLTIAVPTYNRSGCLAQLLEILAPQLAGVSQVELILSDNASPDNTRDVVETFQRNGLSLIYYRNETNIGADANFICCYERAHGEYVWIFGDDDIIVPGALKEVLRYLEIGQFDLIYIHSKGFRDRYDASKTPKFSRRIKVFTRPEDFALHAYTGMTFISGNIVRKGALEQMAHPDFHKLIGTNLAQLSWTFSLLRGTPRCAFLMDDLVAGRMENSGGHGSCQVFGVNLRTLVGEFFGVDSPVGRAILNRTVQSFFPWAMLHGRRNRESSKHLPEDPETILKNLYRRNPRFWFFLYPVLRLPLPLATAWMLTGKIINRLDRAVGFPLAR
jgi:abequosyltransferase